MAGIYAGDRDLSPALNGAYHSILIEPFEVFSWSCPSPLPMIPSILFFLISPEIVIGLFVLTEPFEVDAETFAENSLGGVKRIEPLEVSALTLGAGDASGE